MAIPESFLRRFHNRYLQTQSQERSSRPRSDRPGLSSWIDPGTPESNSNRFNSSGEPAPLNRLSRGTETCDHESLERLNWTVPPDAFDAANFIDEICPTKSVWLIGRRMSGRIDLCSAIEFLLATPEGLERQKIHAGRPISAEPHRQLITCRWLTSHRTVYNRTSTWLWTSFPLLTAAP